MCGVGQELLLHLLPARGSLMTCEKGAACGQDAGRTASGPRQQTSFSRITSSIAYSEFILIEQPIPTATFRYRFILTWGRPSTYFHWTRT
jgi:hypothetical protein